MNNYNNFLKTLDIKSNLTYNSLIKTNNNNNNNNILQNKDYYNDNDNDNEFMIKKHINLINERINITYKLNNYNSIHFTGQLLNDIISSNNKFNDPNYYYDNDTEDKNICIYNSTLKSKNIKKEKLIEHINIDIEINNISDILKLIDTYKDDPTIQYNINMKALYNIKEPLKELNDMIGLTEIKNNIIDQIIYFIQGLHKNTNMSGDFMHTVIYGPPGTGKTEIAKMMGKIYSKIGILSKGTFKKVTRNDLIAGYLGQTAIKTNDVIKEAIGGVLFIDEAYALGNSEKKDSFSKECIDTLCEALSDNKENLMVIIAGYETELKECFFSHNEGLESRFIWRFKTDEYSGEDLYNIFIKKVKDINWEIIDENSQNMIDWFKKNKDCFKFYGRDIESLLTKTKIAHSKRVFCKSEIERKKINLKDLEKGFEIYLKNTDIKKRKDQEYLKKYISNTMYC